MKEGENTRENKDESWPTCLGGVGVVTRAVWGMGSVVGAGGGGGGVWGAVGGG